MTYTLLNNLLRGSHYAGCFRKNPPPPLKDHSCLGTAGIEQEIQVDLQGMFWLESHQLARSEIFKPKPCTTKFLVIIVIIMIYYAFDLQGPILQISI